MSGLLGSADLGLELASALVDDLQLRQVGVENAHNLGDLVRVSSRVQNTGLVKACTHRLVRLIGLAQRRGGAIDLLDHASQILAHLVQALG